MPLWPSNKFTNLKILLSMNDQSDNFDKFFTKFFIQNDNWAILECLSFDLKSHGITSTSRKDP